MTKKPIYHFIDTASEDVIDVPLGRMIYVVSSQEFYIMDNTTGLVQADTISDAITAGNIVPLNEASVSIGNLDSDGTIPMDVGYAPVNDQDISTKVSVTEEIITKLEANMSFDVGIFRGI